MFEKILRDFERADVVSFHYAAERKYQELRSARVRIGTLDLRIASIALTRGYTVLTRNTVDFGKVPGLDVQDWTLPEA
jgi:tRNA(fMet)-specific endonuclease VapC